MVRAPFLPAKRLLGSFALTLLMGSTALAAGQGDGAAPAYVRVRYTLSEGHHPWPTTEVVFAEVYRSDGQPRFWIAERRFSSQFAQPMLQHQWIDGRRCPALNATLEKLKDVPLRFPGADPVLPAPLDVSPLKFSGIGLGASVYAITVEVYRGPLYQWWRSSQPTLDDCWQDTAVMQGDRPLLNELPTRADHPAL